MYTYICMHIYICIHIYIIVCVCVCACVQLLAALIGVVLVSLLEMVNENHYEIADPSPGRISQHSALCSLYSVNSVAS